MRSVSVLCACLLTACSTQAVRCERHLTPINIPKRPIANALAPGQPEASSAAERGARRSDGTPRPTAPAQSVSLKPPALAPAPSADHEGSP